MKAYHGRTAERLLTVLYNACIVGSPPMQASPLSTCRVMAVARVAVQTQDAADGDSLEIPVDTLAYWPNTGLDHAQTIVCVAGSTRSIVCSAPRRCQRRGPGEELRRISVSCLGNDLARRARSARRARAAVSMVGGQPGPNPSASSAIDQRCSARPTVAR